MGVKAQSMFLFCNQGISLRALKRLLRKDWTIHIKKENWGHAKGQELGKEQPSNDLEFLANTNKGGSDH